MNSLAPLSNNVLEGRCSRWKLKSLLINGTKVSQEWCKGEEVEEEIQLSSSFQLPYSQEEYDACLISFLFTLILGLNFTKEETDYLMELCASFHRNFIAITDRYDFEGKSRSREELTERYYEVLNSLSCYRNDSNPQINYPRKQEEERRALLLNSFKKTCAQVEEEQFLIQELHEIQRNYPFLVRQRENILSLLAGDMIMATGSDGTTAALRALKRKKKKTSKPSSILVRSEHYNPFSAANFESKELSRKEKQSNGASLRSAIISFPKVASKHLEKILADFAIGICFLFYRTKAYFCFAECLCLF